MLELQVFISGCKFYLRMVFLSADGICVGALGTHLSTDGSILCGNSGDRFNHNMPHASIMLTLPEGPNPGCNLQAMAWEIIISSILMLVIRGSTTDPRAHKQVGGIAVGAMIFCIIIVAGTIIGASMNPVRSLGPAIVANNFNKIWNYMISHVIGKIIGSTIHNFFKMSKTTEDKSKMIGAIPDANNHVALESSFHSGHYLEVV